jgi:signal peptidase I
MKIYKSKEIIIIMKKSLWKSFTHFWNDDSPKSWIIFLFVILPILFILIKFVIFPSFNLISGSSQTLVVIETGSMHHDGNIGNILYFPINFNNYWNQAEDWYLNHNITKEQFKIFPFRTGMEIGDIIVLSKRGEIQIGDIIVFEAGQQRPVIHRVISIKNENNITIYSTKGDANPSQLSFEISIPENKVLGKAIAKFPRLGLPKVIAARIFKI